MKNIRHRSVLLGAFFILAAYALAYTTGPCQTTYPTCDLTKEGAQCGGGAGAISFGPPAEDNMFYCGGNTSGRCGGPNSQGTCSELLWRTCWSRAVYCGDTLLGYCFFNIGNPTPMGYDCGLNPCDDVPANQRTQPIITGPWAPCDSPHGTPCVPFAIPH